MINRVSFDGGIVFAGGVAKNVCMCKLSAETLGPIVRIPDDPQQMGALGAALLAVENGVK